MIKNEKLSKRIIDEMNGSYWSIRSILIQAQMIF